MKINSRFVWLWLLALFFIAAGVNHFVNPGPYLSMMPRSLPRPGLLVQISGIAEILGGVGILLPITRRMAAWGLIVLLVAVFPANLNVALNGWPNVNIPAWALWLRLPVQLLLLWSVHRICLYYPKKADDPSFRRSTS